MALREFLRPLFAMARTIRKKGSLLLTFDEIKQITPKNEKVSTFIKKYMDFGLIRYVSENHYSITDAGWYILHSRKSRETHWSVIIILTKPKKWNVLLKQLHCLQLKNNIFFKEFEPSDYQLFKDPSLIHLVSVSKKLEEFWRHSATTRIFNIKQKISKAQEKLEKIAITIDHAEDEYALWKSFKLAKETLSLLVDALALHFSINVSLNNSETLLKLKNKLPHHLFTSISDAADAINTPPSLKMIYQIIMASQKLIHFLQSAIGG